jgi:hypothetical protein
MANYELITENQPSDCICDIITPENLTYYNPDTSLQISGCWVKRAVLPKMLPVTINKK